MRSLIILGLLVLTGNLLATALPVAKISLTGTIVTKEGEPLEYATVSVYTALDSNLVDGTVTDAAGEFSLQLSGGDYYLQVEFIGYATRRLGVELRSKTDLGTIAIDDNSLTLDAVEVTASKSQMNLQLDKKVFNVGEDALAQGGAATDLLAQVPSVAVSAEGTVSLRGNSSVRILINGRPSALADNGSLDAIPSASIERVEIITNPSAKFEAEGSAGIINIVLKKSSERGYGGSLTLGTGFPADHRLSLNVNYRHEKFNAFVNLGARYADFRGDGEVSRTTTFDGATTNVSRITDMDRNDKAWSVFTGFDYNFSEQSTLTASYSRYDVVNDDSTLDTYDYTDGEGHPINQLRQVQDYLEPGLYQQVDLVYNTTFSVPERKFSVQLSHDIWAEDENESIKIDQTAPLEKLLNSYRTRTLEGSRDYLLRANYESPVGEYGKFEAGLRAETRIISADYLAELAAGNDFTVIPGFENKFDYYERIGSGYVQYAFEKDKFGLQLGLRNEWTGIETDNTDSEQVDLKKNYYRLFPSGSLQYEIGEGLSTQLSFSRRLRRPQFWQLNPFGGIRQPSVLFFGNPDLDPAYTNRVEANLLLQKDKVTFNPAIYYSITSDYFQNVVEQVNENIFGLEDGTIKSRPTNLERQNNFGLETTISYRPTEALTFNGDVHVYGYRQRGEFAGRSFDFDFATWTTGLRTQLRLPNNLSLQTHIGYSAGREDVQSRAAGVWSGSAAVSKRFEKKFTLSFNVSAPRYFRETTFRPSFLQEEYFQWTGWRFRAALQYRFERGAKAEERRERGSIR